MLNKNSISYIPKSHLFDTLNIQTTTESSILSSTKDFEKRTLISNNNNRRKSILPTPHNPRIEHNFDQKTIIKDSRSKSREGNVIRFDIDSNTDESCIKNSNAFSHTDSTSRTEKAANVDNSRIQNYSVDVKDVNRDQKSDETNKIITKTYDCSNKYSSDNEIDDQQEIEDDANKDSFDNFILHNFVPYSGKENVICWLDVTEEKFNQHCIGRNLRFEAISLLVEGDAKRRYIKHRKEINCYDDFYEFLLVEFESRDNTSYPSKFSQKCSNQSIEVAVSDRMKTAISLNQTSFSNSNAPSSISQLRSFNSPTTVTHDVSDSIGEKSANKVSTTSDNLSSSMLDHTLNDLRKAIVGNLIKNPKTFKGGKDDVKKWIEEIEHLLDLAHIPESTRLDLISYSLRGDALEWFKNNRASLSSWSVFVLELKRAFTSSFHEELAFKKLELYSQAENQSIRNFYNEVIKLCKEADSSMSDATKLKNLLSKTKPSIQLEVRKKKPKSPAEFLEFAKEAEELIQLSEMSTDISDNQTKTQVVKEQPSYSVTSTQSAAKAQSSDYPSKNYSTNYSRNLNNSYRFSQNRNNYPNRNYSSFSNNTTPQSKYQFNNNSSSRSYRPQYSNDSVNKSNKNTQSSSNNSTNTTSARQRTANAIEIPHTSPDTDIVEETFSSISCNRCHQFGHETSVCPNF